MPTYEVELSDGRMVDLEADHQPSESEVMAAIGSGQPERIDAGALLADMGKTVDQYEASLPANEFLARHGVAPPQEPDNAVGMLHEIGKTQLVPWSPPTSKGDDTVLGAPSAALYNTFLKGTYDFVNTPYGVASLGLGAGPAWLKKLAGVAFAREMAGAAGEKAGEFSVTHDPKTGYEALFSAAPVPFLARPAMRFGENIALTPGDQLKLYEKEIGNTPLPAGEFLFNGRSAGEPTPITRIGINVNPADTIEARENQELASRALSEAQSPIVVPGRVPALELLRRQEQPLSEVSPAALLNRPGGGEAQFGKVSFMREAEAPLPEMTREAISKETPRTEPPPEEPRGTPVETTKSAGSTYQEFLKAQKEYARQNPGSPPLRFDEWRGMMLDAEPPEARITRAVDSINAEDPVSGLSDVVRLVRRAANDPDMAKAAVEGFKKVGDAAQQQGIPVNELKQALVDEMRRTYGDAAPEMMEHYFGKSEQLPGEATKQIGATDTSPASDLVRTLESWKYETDAQGRILNPQGQLFALPHPDAIKAIGKGIWNDTIDVAIAAIKAGRLAKEAIDMAIGYLKKQASGFDESKIRENLSKLLELESPRVEGTEDKMRKSAARATTSRQVPEPVQEKIAQAPESFYKVQPMKSVEQAVAAMPDAELAAVPESSNIHVAAKLELSKRLFDAGKLDEGYEVFKSVSKTGTDFGQNINQFKFLKGQNPLNIVHLVNKGLKESGRDPLTTPQAKALADVAQKSIDANKALEGAKDKWVSNPTDGNAKAADAALKSADAADLATQREIAKFNVQSWPRMLKAFAQGNPLTPISQVANIVGNSLGAAMEAGTRATATTLDIIRSAITGGERKVSVQPVRGTIEAAKGFGRGLAKAPGILAKGSANVIKGETRQGLHPLKAFVKMFAKNPDGPTVGGNVPFNERARLAVEAMFGIPPETMLRLLAAADKPAYESARARLIAEQLNIQKVPRDKWGMAQKFPELFFNRETMQLIGDESASAVFQRKSKSVSYLESLIKEKTGDWGDLAFTLLVAPYRLTPWNLVGRTLAYNPLIAATRVGLDSAKGDVRGAEMNAGRMVVGGMLYTAGYFLYKNGLIGPSLDSRDEQQKARLLSNEVLPPNHVNVDGLKRLMNGGNPAFKAGDETWDLTRGGGAAGAILTTVANIGRDFEKKPEDSQEWAGTLLKNSTLEQASFTVNQSFLKGVTGVFDAIRDRNIEPYMEGVENMVLNVPTPNTLTTLSRATRPYVPDLSADKLGQKMENVVRNRFGVAGLDDYLPIKRDLWGKPMLQTPEGRNALLYHLFDISKNRQVTDDPVALELYDLWRRTDDTRVIPSLPTKSVTIMRNNYPLSPDQYSRFAEVVGQSRREIVEQLVLNPNWQNIPEEHRIRILEQAYNAGLERGKATLWLEYQGQLKPKAAKAGFTAN